VKKIRIFFSLVRENNDYQRLQASAAAQAAERLDVDLQVRSANGDSIKQGQDLLDVIQTPALRPDAIMVEPAGTSMPQVARAAVAAGIGWVVLNKHAEYLAELRSNYRLPLFAVSSDNEQIGRLQGQQLAALLPQGGFVLCIQGPANTTSELRMAGFNQTRPKNAELRTLRGDWTQESGHKAISAWLRLSTSRATLIGVVASQNDDMAMGARKALEEHGRLRGVPIIGVDGVPETGQAWVRSGALTATVISPANAGLAIEMLVHALQTGACPPEYTVIPPECYPPIKELAARPATVRSD
jgi:ABC-type sugar transport system substrate-binding protein